MRTGKPEGTQKVWALVSLLTASSSRIRAGQPQGGVPDDAFDGGPLPLLSSYVCRRVPPEMDRRGFPSADKLREDHVLKFLFGPTESTVPLYELNQIAPLFSIDFSGLIMVREECLRRFRSRTFSRDTAWSRRPGAGLLTWPGSHQPVGTVGSVCCPPLLRVTLPLSPTPPGAQAL